MVLDNSEIKKESLEIKDSLNERINNQLLEKEQDFLKRYKITNEKLKELYNFSSKNELKNLNEELSKLASNNHEKNDLIEAFNELLNLKEKTKNEVLNLKEELSENQSDSLMKKFFWLDINRYKNPKNTKEYIIKWILWAWESLLWTSKLTYDLLVWIISLPKDLYMIRTKKWKYNWFRDI